MATSRNIPVSGRNCVAGLYQNESTAEAAISELKDRGFNNSEIGVATAGDGQATTQSHSGFWNKVASAFGKHEHAESASDFEETLQESGMSADQARYFNSSLDRGKVLVTVCAGDRVQLAREILQSTGADIGSSASVSNIADRNRPVEGERRIQLVGEILRVHKDRVQRGEVRLRKEVVTENQNLEVPVTREELVIERVPVEGREASGQVGAGEKEVRVPLTEEQVRVEKKPVVNEEVRVGKRQVQDTKKVSDTVRHEELRTEHEGDVKDEKLRDLDKKRRSA
jgi:uncharacterized protein (TIGR02271 family)